MTESKAALFMLKGTISELEQDEQDKIAIYIAEHREIMAMAKELNEEELSQLAMTVIGLEMAVSLE
jgi:hypothetical protein